MSRFSAGAFRPATLSIAGLALAGVVVVAIAALPGGASAQPGPSSPPATGSPSGPPPATPSAAPVDSPSPTATPAPVVTPIPTATPAEPSATPDGGTDAIPLNVDLETFDGHAVSLDVVDRTGTVSDAASGHPGDGATVDANRLEVTNVDARTLRLTWIDVPIANRDVLFVDDAGGHLRLLLIQPEHDGPTDAIGFDRELILSFDRPVDASTVERIIQGGLDTSG